MLQINTHKTQGPGFINLKYKEDFIFHQLSSMLKDEERLGVPFALNPQNIVVDFSSPNIAKEMHGATKKKNMYNLFIYRYIKQL